MIHKTYTTVNPDIAIGWQQYTVAVYPRPFDKTSFN